MFEWVPITTLSYSRNPWGTLVCAPAAQTGSGFWEESCASAGNQGKDKRSRIRSSFQMLAGCPQAFAVFGSGPIQTACAVAWISPFRFAGCICCRLCSVLWLLDDHGEIGRSLLGGPTLLAGMGQAILPDYVIKPSLPQPQRNKILFGPEEVATSYEFLDTSMCISGPRLWQLTPILYCLRLPDAARSST